MRKFSINNSQFTINSQFSILNEAAADVWKLLLENSLKIENCKMRITAQKGVA